MEQLAPFLFVGGMLLILSGLFFYSRYQTKQREAAIERIASTLGYIFERQSSSLLQRFGKQPELLPRQRRGKLLNILHGEVKRQPLMVFDYRYITGSGRSRRAHYQTTYAAELPLSDLPPFSIRRRAWHSNLTGWLRSQQVSVDYHAAFEERFVLQYAGDPSNLETHLPPAFLDLTLDFERLELTCNGRWLAIANARRRLDADIASYETFIERSTNLSRILMDKYLQ